MRSMVGWRSRPKSMNFHSIPSRWYSSCSRMNICGGQEIITVVIIIVAYYVSDDMQNVFVKQHTAILRSSRLKIYSPCG